MIKSKTKKIRFDGITFENKKEARRYMELLLMKKSGMISDLKYKVPYLLLDGYIKNGSIIRPITYIADFVYIDEMYKKTIIEDLKEQRKEDYKIKLKMLIAKYPELEVKEL